MSVDAWVDGDVRRYGLEQLWEHIQVRARALHPERYAPDGTGLVLQDSTCRHTQEQRTRGCGDAWAHRLASWQRRTVEPEIPE